MTTNRPGDPRAQRIAAAAGLCLLVAVLTPQAIIQAGGGVRLDREYGTALALGAAVLAFVMAGYWMLEKILPRTADHQLVARYISGPLSVVAASARLVSYALVVALAAGFSISSLAPVLDLESLHLPLVQAGAVLLLALPTIAGWRVDAKIVAALLIPAALSAAAIIIGGLIIELAGGLTTLPEAGEIASTEGVRWPLGETVLGACVPAALLGLITERGFGEGPVRRTGLKRLMRIVLPVAGVIAALMYLSSVVSLSARTESPSSLALAEVFFPEAVVTVIALSFSAAGVAVGLGACAQVIPLLRLLASDGILPRHIAAADAHGSRRIVFATIVLTGAVAIVIIASPLGGATMAVTIMFASFAMTMAAVVARARAVQRQSTDPVERKDARQSKRIALVLGMIIFALIIIGILVQPVFSGVGLLALAVPSAALLVLRRGMGKIGATLAASDLSAGRSLPTRVHAIVLVEKLDRPTLQAISYVRATRPSSITGLVVDVDPEATEILTRDWMAAELPVELTILGTPRGAARRPVIDHVRSLRRSSPRDIVIIYAPRVVSSSAAWQRFFVSHSTPALLSELKLEPGVIVAEVPYQIEDSEEQ